MDNPPTLAEVAKRYPHWHRWDGISGLIYARRKLSSPPAVVRATSEQELADKITQWEKEHKS